MPRGIYERTRPTGFLKPVHRYEVRSGNRVVHQGKHKRPAVHAFRRFVKLSIDGYGEPGNQPVQMFKDAELIETHHP